MRILLLEDDFMIGEALQDALKEACYAVDWLQDGRLALTALTTQHYDFLLLDLGLPGTEGMTVLKELRERRLALPVLIITARDAVQDCVDGLDQGADDYLVKPFELKELLARIRALLRRQGGTAAPVLGNGKFFLNPATHEAWMAGSASVSLSSREFSVLQALMLRPGAILSRSDLEDRVYGWGEEVESNVIEYLIHGLRRKLGSDVIKNVRGVGWRVDKGA